MGNHRRKKSSVKPSAALDNDPPLTASPTWSSSSSDVALTNGHTTSNSHLKKGQSGMPSIVDFSKATKRKSQTTCHPGTGSPTPHTTKTIPPSSTIRAKLEDILVLAIVFCGFALLSVCVGIAAGISISVHYFESTTATAAAAAASSLDPNHSTTRLIILLLIYGSTTGSAGHSMQNLLQGLRRTMTTTTTTLPHLLTMDELIVSYEVHPHPTTGRHMLMPIVAPPPPLVHVARTSPPLAVPPAPCPTDSTLMGYTSWTSLHTALRYMKTSRSAEQLSTMSAMLIQHLDDSQYYEPPTVLTICPGSTLRGRDPLPLDTPSVHITCLDCVLDGPLRISSYGIVLQGLTLTQPITIVGDGADVRVEDATFRMRSDSWEDAVVVTTMAANKNVHNAVELYRCFLESSSSARRRWW